jgi:hypothetical protein
MRRALWVLVAATCLSAQVRFAKDSISINVDGKPFTVFHYGAESGKPYLAPIRAASGKIITRRFPVETVAGESTGHPGRALKPRSWLKALGADAIISRQVPYRTG